MITFKKIDRRYNGGTIYQYMLLVNSRNLIEEIRTFNKIRQWCESIWGYSYELHDAWAWEDLLHDYPLWTWANDSKDKKRAIYLKTDKEYMLAKLRWE